MLGADEYQQASQRSFVRVAERIARLRASDQPFLIATLGASVNACGVLLAWCQDKEPELRSTVVRELAREECVDSLFSILMPAMAVALRASGPRWAELPPEAVRVAPEPGLAASTLRKLDRIENPSSFSVLAPTTEWVAEQLKIRLEGLDRISLGGAWQSVLVKAVEQAQSDIDSARRSTEGHAATTESRGTRAAALQLMRSGTAREVVPIGVLYRAIGFVVPGVFLLLALSSGLTSPLGLLLAACGLVTVAAHYEWRVRRVMKFLRDAASGGDGVRNLSLCSRCGKEVSPFGNILNMLLSRTLIAHEFDRKYGVGCAQHAAVTTAEIVAERKISNDELEHFMQAAHEQMSAQAERALDDVS